jgi:hypothetical protein
VDLLPLTAAAVVLLTGACGQAGDAASGRHEQTPSPALEACDEVVVADGPITGRQLLDGCRDSDGTVLAIPFYPCRGTGNVVAGLVYRDKGWSGELALAWEEKPRRDETYGTWHGGYAFTGDDELDVAGCLQYPPGLVESPAP